MSAQRYRAGMNTSDTARGARYRIVMDPAAHRLRPIKIADESYGGAFCSLPDVTGQREELAFRDERQARAWLAACNERRRPTV